MIVEIFRQIVLRRKKKPEMAHTGPTPCQFDKSNCQLFINIQKYKVVFKIRKDHLRIILFIILDPLRNIYEIYADLTLMGLLILNHF